MRSPVPNLRAASQCRCPLGNAKGQESVLTGSGIEPVVSPQRISTCITFPTGGYPALYPTYQLYKHIFF